MESRRIRTTRAGRRRTAVFVLAAVTVCTAVLLPGCTSGAELGSSGTVALSRPSGRTNPGATTSSSVTPTPVTPNGLITGPGVSDSTITLGLLTDSAVDRGFSVGAALWQRYVNTAGGICGRTIKIEANRTGETPTAGYARIAGSTLGLITLPGPTDSAPLAALSSADQVPALTLAGSSATLSKQGPVVIGATEDIKAINALAYLRSIGKLRIGGRLGVVSDGSTDAVNALAGARWWAAANGVIISPEPADSHWTGVDAILAMTGPARVRETLAASASDVWVITNLNGYDPVKIPNPGGRLLISLAAPAYGSDNPGAAAVAEAFTASGQRNPGPNLMSGYGVGASWGRLLTQACTNRTLTRTGVLTALATVGPASLDSLFGPADPALVIDFRLPATRVSAVASADPKAPAGLRPLTWLRAAPGLGDYIPAR